MKLVAFLCAFAVAACATGPELVAPTEDDAASYRDLDYCTALANGSSSVTGGGVAAIVQHQERVANLRAACLMERGWRVKH